jgi:hypothetical protein
MALWYYKPNRDLTNEFGPVEFEIIAEMVRDGILNARSQVRNSESTLWLPLSRVRGLSLEELFQTTEALVLGGDATTQEADATAPVVSDTSRFWEHALELPAGALSPVLHESGRKPEPSRRWRIRRPKAPKMRINRASWKWRIGESLTVATTVAMVVGYLCRWYTEQPERYPIPRRLQNHLGEGARFLFGTGPWSPSEVLIISFDLSLLAAVAIGIACFCMSRHRSAG